MGISILAWLSSLDPYWRSRDDNQANMEMVKKRIGSGGGGYALWIAKQTSRV
jgi:hypothetical protein